MIWGHSPVLGLDLCWDDGHLRVYDPVAGAYLPTSAELQARHAAERAARLTAEPAPPGLKTVPPGLKTVPQPSGRPA